MWHDLSGVPIGSRDGGLLFLELDKLSRRHDIDAMLLCRAENRLIVKEVGVSGHYVSRPPTERRAQD